MGTLLHSFVEVREPIELSFGVMSGIGLGIRALDERPRAPREGEDFGGFRPRWFEWHSLEQKCIRLVREKLIWTLIMATQHRWKPNDNVVLSARALPGSSSESMYLYGPVHVAKRLIYLVIRCVYCRRFITTINSGLHLLQYV